MAIWSRLFALLQSGTRGSKATTAKAAAQAAHFGKRMAMLAEMTEEQQISNLEAYLKATDQVIEQLRLAKAPDAVIQKTIVELQLAAAMAQRDAMVAVRSVGVPLTDSSPTPERKVEVTINPTQTSMSRGSSGNLIASNIKSNERAER